MKKEAEKKTASAKMNSFLEKHRKGIIAAFIVILVALIGFIVFSTIKSSNTEKMLAEIETISYELTKDSKDLSEDDLNARCKDALAKLETLNTKGGITGIRANLLSAELAYYSKDYSSAAKFWEAAASKNAKAYTTPIAYYQQGVCYEQLNDFSKAADCYKAAAENKTFYLHPHAAFSYGRVLESQGNYSAAVEVYQSLVADYESDSWADLAKTRILSLQIEGKAE